MSRGGYVVGIMKHYMQNKELSHNFYYRCCDVTHAKLDLARYMQWCMQCNLKCFIIVPLM